MNIRKEVGKLIEEGTINVERIEEKDKAGISLFYRGAEFYHIRDVYLNNKGKTLDEVITEEATRIYYSYLNVRKIIGQKNDKKE